MAKDFIQNTFTGGMNMDVHPSAQDNTTYRYGLNLVSRDFEQHSFVSNENSNRLCGSFGSTIIGSSYVDERNSSIVFLSSGEIHMLNHDSCQSEFICSDSEFGCDWHFGNCEWIDAKFKSIEPCRELMIYWSSGCEYYKVNADEMLDRTRKEALKSCMKPVKDQCSEIDCTYFNVFKKACSPNISAVASIGGQLSAGAYQFVTRFMTPDGGYTNWFNMSDPVYVESDHNAPGERSNGKIDVNISCLDCNFSGIELAVIETVGGSTRVRLITTSGYNTKDFTYVYSGHDGEDIDIREILIKGKTYIQGQDLTIKDGRAFYYNIKQRKNVDYQYKSNQVVTEWVKYKVPYTVAKKYNLKSYMRGETYSFGMVLNYQDGTHSYVFPIPASPGGGGSASTNTAGYSDKFIADYTGGSSGQANIFSLQGVTGELIYNEEEACYCVKEIPCVVPEFGSGGQGGGSGSSGGNSGAGQTSSISQEGKRERTRVPKEDSVNDPQLDDFSDALQTLIDAMKTTTDDICTSLDECKECDSQCLNIAINNSPCCDVNGNPVGGLTEQEIQDIIDDAIAAQEPCCLQPSIECNETGKLVEEMGAKWGNIIHSLIEDSPDTDLQTLTPSNVFIDSASKMLNAIRGRERLTSVGVKYQVNKPVTYVNSVSSLANLSGTGTHLSGGLFDCCGLLEAELEFEVVSTGRTTPVAELNTKYPDMKNCSGDPIFRGLAGQPVQNHQFPWASDQPHYESKSVGVPSAATPDADEHADAYVHLMGVRFSSISLPTEEEISLPLCKNNPYTIVQIKRTDRNKTIHSKGMFTGTFKSSNQGKDYLYPRHGVNSFETVNRYIDLDGSRLDAGATSEESYNFWSLDTMAQRKALFVENVRLEGKVSGIGFRHGLFAIGKKPDNNFYGSRIDQRGTRQGVNLSVFEPAGSTTPVDYIIGAQAHDTISPPMGGDIPLMNKYQQESIWVGANLGAITDKSFVGDVLDHAAPIDDAKAHYGALTRDLENQYGDLTNQSYIPILFAGKNNSGQIEGLSGDVFIGPMSFVKTSYVSDKVGNKFPISNMIPRKEDRSVCDGPDDALHSFIGDWVHSTLPEEYDEADPKNWAGTHTDTYTHRWSIAKDEASLSEYYYYKTLTTMITFWGEFETNPYLRQRGDILENQVYPNFQSEWGLDSTVESNSGEGWDNDYLNQFYCEVAQPSEWAITRKTLIRTLLTILVPLLGLEEFFNFSNGIEFVGDLTTAPMMATMWYMMTEVLFTNSKLDKLLGILPCKTDDEGGEGDGCIRKFFTNYAKYNSDYNIQNQYYNYISMPIPYYTCDCDDCENSQTTNEIYYSDQQVTASPYDSFGNVRPNNSINVDPSEGKIRKIFTMGSGLYVHTTEQIMAMQYGKSQIPSDLGSLIMGTGDLLRDPQPIKGGTAEGFAGLASPQHSINTQYGYIFLDYEGKRIYIFNQGLQDITDIDSGMNSFFRDRIGFCSGGDCFNERTPGSASFSLGIDPRLDRILITKTDGEACGSWTLSYDVKRRKWISFHSYIPQSYAWDRDHMLSIDNGSFYKHDENCSYQNFGGKYFPHILEFVTNNPGGNNDRFDSGLLDTEANNCTGTAQGNFDRHTTFNKMWKRTAWASTGMLPIKLRTDQNCTEENLLEKITEDSENVELVFESGVWRYNNIKNNIVDPQGAILSYPCDCLPVNPDSVNTDPCTPRNTHSQDIHFDNSLYTTLVLDNFTEQKIYTKAHSTYINKTTS